MTEITSGSEIRDVVPAQGMKILGIKTAATADAGDTLVLTLGSHGIADDGLVGVFECLHTTEDSVVIMPGTSAVSGAAGAYNDNSTTAVSSGVLTITLGTMTDKAHGFLIVGTGPA